MKAPKTTNKDPLNIRKIAIYGAVLWTIFMSAVLILDIKLIKQETLNRAYTYSKVGFDKDVIYRQWVSERGGVYLKSDSLTPPNPYLSHITDRDISIDSNVFFTLVNPAYMTRMVYELQEASTDVRGHITSLNCLRPENAPDLWEIEALKAFEVGEPEYSGIDSLDGKEYFRYMKPFFVENSCLKCHAKQGYQVGDIRGGISVSYPMDQVYLLSEGDSHYHNTLHLILWLLGLGVIIIAYHQIKKSDNKRLIAEDELRYLNYELEEKVEIRTQEVLKKEQIFSELIKSAPDALLQVDGSGRILLANQQVSEIFGYTHEELIGEAIEKLVPFNFRAGHIEHRKKYEKHPSTRPMARTLELMAERKDGSQFEVEISLSSIQNNDGLLVTAIIRDISDRKKAQKKLELSNKKFEDLIQSLDEGFLRADAQGYITKANIPIAKMCGYPSPSEMLGVNMTTLYAEFSDRKDMINAVKDKGMLRNYELLLQKKNGDNFWTLNNINLIIGENGEILGTEGLIHDITERKLAEKELQKSERYLKEAQKIGKLGFWDLNVATGDLEWSDESFVIYGFEPQEFVPTFQKFEEIVFPGDIERVQQNVDDAFKGVSMYDIDFRFVRPDGGIGWIHCEGKVSFDEKGKATRFFGIQIDITERKQAESELIKAKEKAEESKTNLNSLLNNREDSIWSIDKNYNYIIFNDFFKEAYFSTFNIELTKGLNALNILTPELKEFWKPKYDKALSGENLIFEISNQVENEFHFYEVSLNPIISKDEITGVSALSMDITNRKKAEEEIKKYRENLEELVKERTREIEEKNEALERINKLFIGRELRMAELKKEVDKLKNG